MNANYTRIQQAKIQYKENGVFRKDKIMCSCEALQGDDSVHTFIKEIMEGDFCLL